MTGFLQEVQAAPSYHKLATIKEQMGDEAKDLEAAIENPKIAPAEIWKALRARGYVISERGVNYWCRQARVGVGR